MYGDEDWAREQVVNRAKAIREYERHGLTEGELVHDLGDKPWYSGALILNALGY